MILMVKHSSSSSGLQGWLFPAGIVVVVVVIFQQINISFQHNNGEITTKSIYH